MLFTRLSSHADSQTRPYLRRLCVGFAFALFVMFLGGQFINVDSLGWSNGFSHPLTGWDHLLTMLAVGIWAAQLRGNAIWMLPLAFVGVMSLGGLAGSAGISLPSVEGIILLSCAVFSILITRKVRFNNKINVLIVAFFGFFHGFAHGSEISASASLVSYTLGFMLATLLLHGAGILVAKLVVLAISCLFSLILSNVSMASTSTEILLTDGAKHTLTDPAIELTAFKQQRNFALSEYNCARNTHTLSHYAPLRTASGPTGKISPPDTVGNWRNFGVYEPEHSILSGLSFKHFFPDINQTPGKQLLSNGVGLTSPPHTNRNNAVPHVIFDLYPFPTATFGDPDLQMFFAKPAFGESIKTPFNTLIPYALRRARFLASVSSASHAYSGNSDTPFRPSPLYRSTSTDSCRTFNKTIFITTTT